MSPKRPGGPRVPPVPQKTDDADQTIAEPPRDFTDEIFQQLTGTPAPPQPALPPRAAPAPRPAAGAPPPPDAPDPLSVSSTQPMYKAPYKEQPVFNTVPMHNAPDAFAPQPPYQAPPAYAPPAAPQSAPVVHVPAPSSAAPMSAPQSSPQQEVRVRTPLWALLYLGIAVLAIAFGLFVLFMQSRVVGHF